MNHRSPLVAFLALLIPLFLAVAPAGAQNSVQDLYKQGVSLYEQERYVEALAIFENLVRARPDFVYGRSYLAKTKAAIAANRGSSNDLEGALAKIRIPQINLVDAPIGDVLQYFRDRAEELSGGKVVPNFIYKGTPEQRENTLVSLNLRDVPMTEAIRYVGQLTRTRFTYEEHAVVADPGRTTPTPADAALDEAEKQAKRQENPFFKKEEKPKGIFD